MIGALLVIVAFCLGLWASSRVDGEKVFKTAKKVLKRRSRGEVIGTPDPEKAKKEADKEFYSKIK